MFNCLITSTARRFVEKNREEVMAVTTEGQSKVPRIESKEDFTNKLYLFSKKSINKIFAISRFLDT